MLPLFEPEPPNLEQLHAKLVLVHFIASWCAPCREELASVADFHAGPYRQLAERGLAVIVVSNDARPGDLAELLETEPVPFPVFLDSLGEMHTELGLYGLPATAAIDAEGRVVKRWIGPQDWVGKEFLASLERQLER